MELHKRASDELVGRPVRFRGRIDSTRQGLVAVGPTYRIRAFVEPHGTASAPPPTVMRERGQVRVCLSNDGIAVLTDLVFLSEAEAAALPLPVIESRAQEQVYPFDLRNRLLAALADEQASGDAIMRLGWEDRARLESLLRMIADSQHTRSLLESMYRSGMIPDPDQSAGAAV